MFSSDVGSNGVPLEGPPCGVAELCQWALTRSGAREGTVKANRAVEQTMQFSFLQDSLRLPCRRNQTLLYSEATVCKAFCALPSLPMSIELGVLELLSATVTALPASGPLLRVLQQHPQGRVGAQRTFSTQRVPLV